MNDLTIGKESRVILKFAAPLLLSNLFQQTFHLVDSAMVGRFVSGDALAAVGASAPVIFALVSFVIGIASGGTIIIAQYFGAKKYEEVRKAVDTILIFTFTMSIIIMTAGIVFSRRIFEITNLPEEIIPQATIYVNTFLSGTILLFGFNGIAAILRGLGDSRTPLYFLVAATILNLILDYVFLKFFGWGIRGAALATVISQGLVFILAAIHLNLNHQLVRIKIRQMKFDRSIFFQSIQIGLPSGFQQTFVSLGMVALYSIINNFGTSIITAYSGAGRIENMAMIPAMTFGIALSTFTGQNIGAGKADRVRRGLITTLKMSIGFSLILSMLVVLFRYSLMKIFIDNQEVIKAGGGYLLIVGSCYFIFSIMFTFNGILRGAGDTLIPMFITLFSLWIIRIPLASLLSGRCSEFFAARGIYFSLPEIFNGRLAEKGIWLAIPIAWAVGALFSFFWYKSGRWKKKVVIKQMYQ